MKMWNRIMKAGIPVAAGLLFTAAVNANVLGYPALGIQQYDGDAGVVSTATKLTMDGTATEIVYKIVYSSSGVPSGPPPLTISPRNFFLSFDYTTGLGSLKVANNTLKAQVSNLELFDMGVSNGVHIGLFGADLTYTSGSMVTANMPGRIEGGFNGATGIIIGPGSNFTAGSLTAKIGKVQVVPVPAAVWLFGSALLGLAGIAKRKKVG